MILSCQAQLYCNRTDTKYTVCDHTTRVCECSEKNSKLIDNVCRFCFEIEQRHTFTRYVIDNEIEIPGYGGRVLYFNEQGQLEELPPENPNGTPSLCANDSSRCTDAYTTDGNSFRPIITVNNRFPAPTLIVPNNAIVLVDVYNRLSSEATSIHWHGMHQMNTPWMDGVEHITQCGIAPSSSFRYIFRAIPPGTHWYHSHSGAQRTDGLFGALIVRDTFSPQGITDEPEKYTLTLIDWQKENSLDLFAQIHAGIRYFEQDGVPPTPTSTADTKDPRVPRTCSPDGTEVGPVSYWSGLINGLGRHRNVSYSKTLLSTFVVQSNSSYRFRLIGAQSLFAYRFSIDEHQLKLIATDGHFVNETPLDFIIIHSGERYDFVLETIKETASKTDFIIRAETLEADGSDPGVCRNGQDQLYPLFSDHSAEAILHYGNISDIPSNQMYEQIANSAVPKSTQCAMSGNCKAVNCPFESFPTSYGIECIHIHQLNLLDNIPDDDPQLPDFNNFETKFFNFGFEGDGSTSAINGRNFLFPPAPLQLSQNDIPNKCSFDVKSCENNDRVITPDCLCTHVHDIEYGKTYRFVFTATGPNRTDNRNWNFAHPIHLHGHSFHVAKIGFGDYSDNNGRITSASEDISCNNNRYDVCTDPQWSSGNIDQGKNNKWAPLKDTVLIPAGGYAVVYFKANNPGYWFLHCHIEVHQLEGMAVVINEAQGMHNGPPPNMPQCSNFSWEPEEFRQKESSPSPFQPTRVPSTSKYLKPMIAFIILFCFSLVVIIIIIIIISGFLVYRTSKAKKGASESTCLMNKEEERTTNL